ncbi:unnamed protein product [Paramecium primaurelia]|uniref:Uncharacterized protein n=1 Tax=Paramecium primaurelia TaxID=5886 RepID=A0A8S1LXC9_PARPR|nr:unnamed protein product [Paramecium primaurelia]
MTEKTLQQTIIQDISTNQIYIESVSINMESRFETYYKYLQQRDGDDQNSYYLLNDFTQKTLNNLEVLQNSGIQQRKFEC